VLVRCTVVVRYRVVVLYCSEEVLVRCTVVVMCWAGVQLC